MASTRPLNTTSIFDTPETHRLSAYGRLAALNGFLIGLAICAGYWGPKLLQLADLPTRFVYSGVLSTSVLILLLCMLMGWLTGRANKWWLTLVGWLLTAVLITLILGYLPALTTNWLVWLTETLFRGLFIYPVPPGNNWWSFLVAGMLLIFILFILAILQEPRLSRAYNQLGKGGRLSMSALLVLLLPALLAGVGALMMPDHLGNAPRQALHFVHQGIETVRDTDNDDLFDLSQQKGFNYSALTGVREQLDGPYQLMVGEVDPNGSMITVVALFDSGAWITCQVNADYVEATYLSFCADASRPYTDGFRSLLTGAPLPKECTPRCLPMADESWQGWLQARADRLGDEPQFTRLGQQGSHVWMRAAAADGDFAIECLFAGLRQVQVQECRDVQTGQ